ncbi:lasso peptide biosynthesis B2 protein [Brevundimonas sp. LM2]|uniref:lasso peptide biosynthesis B2 protein n=1 Tax=Brevundimonas sp. LM2 TaxID=1938605 RepID=UPI0015C56270|nr:lasso peptide biosynthesis B2 protein [Brevundimonas sp. LM2]
MPTETRPLAAGVFMAAIEPDVIVLDLATDTYACLPHARDDLSILGPSVEAELGLLGLLADAGLLGDASRSSPGIALDPPVRGFPARPSLWSIPAAASLVVAAATARRLGPLAPIRTLISALPSPPVGHADTARVAAVVAAFTRLLPWVPDQGACLYRAFVLLSMLRRAGQNAVWVFGVRTWPFSAHCWLRIGDAVLDDDPERVSHYTPIMEV